MQTRKKKRKVAKNVKPFHAREEQDYISDFLWKLPGADAPHGWFESPWRDGRNAIGMVIDLVRADAKQASSTEGQTVVNHAVEFLRTWETNPDRSEVYWKSSDLRDSVRTIAIRPIHQMLEAGLRCIELLVSNSHGNGSAYNNVLDVAMDRLYGAEGPPIGVTTAVVSKWRIRDAIGLDETRRRACEIAWKRGLFRLIYGF